MTEKRRRWLIVIGLVVVLVGMVGITAWYKLFREEPQLFASVEEAFKYGSIGNENDEGIPYYVWLILPRAFPEYLPPGGVGYLSLGMAWEEGRETPVGFSKKTIGFPRLGFNCAACHTATYRTSATSARVIVPTGPSSTFDVQGYVRFLASCAQDPRFSADYLLPFVEYNFDLSLVDKLLYRFVIIPRLREGLLEQSARYSWTYERPAWGPGRIDPFNPIKFHEDLLALDPATDSTIGNADMQPLWAMAEQDGYSLHRDGLNTSLTEVVLSGAIGDGARPKTLPFEHLAELEAYLRVVQPPEYPFGRAPNELVDAGGRVFQAECSACHGLGGSRTGTVIPIAEVGTDRHRLDMWTQEAATRYNAYADDEDWDFVAYVKTDGYVAKPLTGIWLQAPYLHNGSVPTLEDLLLPPLERPPTFYRGYDVYDRVKTGFVHDEAAAVHGFLFDISVTGNSNGGHEYGTELSPEEKRALVAFLRTL